jgi:uncharacterized protein with HEPN domain
MQPDEAALLDVAYCCGRIVALTEHVTLEAFEADEALREAVQYRLIVAGEAVKRLSPESGPRTGNSRGQALLD